MTVKVPDFSDWPLDRLLTQRKHLHGLLFASAGQDDPLRPQLRAEHEAVQGEITRRQTCPACLDNRHRECEDPCRCSCEPVAAEGE